MVLERGAQRVNVAETPHGRDHLIQVLRRESEDFLKLAVDADENEWLASTPCEGWQVRDIVAHLTEGTETYLGRYYMAIEGWPAPDPLGLRGYAQALNENALACRGIPQYELIGRLKGSLNQLFQIWEELPDEQWAGLNIHHKYAGPVPQFFMPVFQLMDYTFHNWDIRTALNKPGPIGVEGTGILVPYMVMLHQFTFAPEHAEGLDIDLGIDVGGIYGGTWRIAVKDKQISINEEDITECQAVMHYSDAQEYCLNAYGRTDSAQITGDEDLVKKFRGLFFGL